ncbi:MAG: hypothetical protein IT373_21565 [Polyangiaceae bacterium]|nr:hypothetical protein [Polyangiaceae bacterium]
MPSASSHRIRRLAVGLALVAGVGAGPACTCGDRAAAPGASASAAAREAAPAVPDTPLVAGSFAELVAPPEIYLVGGIQSVDRLARAAQAIVAGIAPGATTPLAAAGPAVAQRLGLSGPSGLDFGQPIHFALFNPNGKDPSVFVFGLKSREAFVQTLPASRQANVQGNAYAYGKVGDAFVNFVGGHAVFTHAPDTFARHRDFLARLAGASLPSDLAVTLAVKNLVTGMGPDLERAVGAFRRALAGRAEASAELGGAAASLGAVLDWVVGAAKDLDHVAATASFADGALVRVEVVPARGSALEKTVGGLVALEPPAQSLLASYPALVPFVLATHLDASRVAPLHEELGRVLTRMLPYPPEVRGPLLDASQKLLSALTGEMVLAAHGVPDGDGLGLTASMVVKDAAQASKALAAWGDALADRRLAAVYAKLGIALERKKAAYKLGAIAFDTLEAKLDPAKAAELGPAAGALADLMTLHFGVGKERAYLAYGPKAKAALEALVGGKLAGGFEADPAVARARERGVPAPLLFLYAQPLELVKALAQAQTDPRAKRVKDGLSLLPPSKAGVALSVGAKDGALSLVLDAPAEQLQRLVELAVLVKMSSMGQLVPAPAPSP